MAEQHVLAIDLGTGGPKAALVTTEGHITAHEFEPTELILLPGGGAEQDPEAVVDRHHRRGATPARRRPGRARRHRRGQRHRAVVGHRAGGRRRPSPVERHDLDGLTRRALHQAGRSAGGSRIQGYDPRKLRLFIQRTGGAPSHSGKDPIAHILWIRRRAARPLPGGARLPRTGRLPQRPDLWSTGVVVRLHRRPLGHRQPRRASRPLRRPAPRPVRHRPVEAARARALGHRRRRGHGLGRRASGDCGRAPRWSPPPATCTRR